MAVSDNTLAKVKKFESEFKGVYIDTDITFIYSDEGERLIFIAFNLLDKRQLLEVTELAESIGNSTVLRSGNDLKEDYPELKNQVVLVIF